MSHRERLIDKSTPFVCHFDDFLKFNFEHHHVKLSLFSLSQCNPIFVWNYIGLIKRLFQHYFFLMQINFVAVEFIPIIIMDPLICVHFEISQRYTCLCRFYIGFTCVSISRYCRGEENIYDYCDLFFLLAEKTIVHWVWTGWPVQLERLSDIYKNVSIIPKPNCMIWKQIGFIHIIYRYFIDIDILGIVLTNNSGEIWLRDNNQYGSN